MTSTVREKNLRFPSTRHYLDGKVKTVHTKIDKNTIAPRQNRTSTASSAILHQVPILEPELPLHTNVPLQQQSYGQRKINDQSKWNKLRSCIWKAAVEGYSYNEALCVECKEENAPFFCSSCGPEYRTCEQCAVKTHQLRPFHDLQVWNKEAYTYIPYKLKKLPIIRSRHHIIKQCITNYVKLVVINDAGFSHEVYVAVCNCESLQETLVRVQLWPSTPDNPRIAYTQAFLQWAVAFQLECHVSLLGFCEAVRWKNVLNNYEHRSISRLRVTESFGEFRHFLYQLKTLNQFVGDLDDGTVCPACPDGDKTQGTCMVALDANFGLVHKKSAAKYGTKSKHKNTYFLPFDEVHSYVDQRDLKQQKRSLKTDCNNFQAADKLRAKVKNAKLDCTGVFGAICRHAVPVVFTDMKYGERLAYSLYVIKNLLQNYSKTLYVHYDIACLLSKHMQTHSPDEQRLLNDTKLAVPVFHSYGHQASCQCLYNPRKLEGFGLCDGEMTERLWSYLRPFAAITKQMSLGNRTDLLTDALLHYAYKKKLFLGKYLMDKLRDAAEIKQKCLEDLQELLTTCRKTTTNVIMWKQEQHKQLTDQQSEWTIINGNKPTSWEEQYVVQLELMNSIRTDMLSTTELHQAEARMNQLQELERKTKKLETDNRLTIRWKSTDHRYKEILQVREARRKKAILHQIHQCDCEKNFLLELRKNYADGQEIAIRLTKQINQQAANIKKLLEAFNAGTHIEIQGLPQVLDIHSASDVYKSLYPQCDINTSDPDVPISTKYKAIDLLCRHDRAREEIRMLKEDINNTRSWYAAQVALVDAEMKTCSANSDDFNKGKQVLLAKKFILLKQITMPEVSVIVEEGTALDVEVEHSGIQDSHAQVISNDTSDMEYEYDACVQELLSTDDIFFDCDDDD